MKIIDIDTGVVRWSLAWRLSRRGIDVTLIELATAVSDTTGSRFAWTNANQKTPEDYSKLNRAGMEAHQSLRDELGETPWLHGGGDPTDDPGWIVGQPDRPLAC